MSLFAFRDVSYREGGRTHLDRVSFSVEPGERLVVFGRSGSGKHLLLRLAAGALMPTRGSIAAPDSGAGTLPVGFVANEGGMLNNLTLVQNAALPLVYHGLLDRPSAEQAARALLTGWGLRNEGERRPSGVGISAQRMAQLARAKLVRPSLYLLEDPLQDVDAATARLLRRVLEELLAGRSPAVPALAGAIGAAGLQGKGPACLVTTGDLAAYLDWGTRFLLLRGARVSIFEGKDALLGSGDDEVREFLAE